MDHKVRKLLLLIILPLALWMAGKPILAGSINADEARVIETAKGTFEYQGEQYVAKQEYLDKLTSKLSQDDCDLTSEEADEAILGIYANIEKGIQEEYIVKVGEDQNNKEDREKPDEHTQTESTPSNETEDGDNGEVIRNTSNPYEAPTILKDTGFHLNGTILLIMIGMVMLSVCICVMIRDKIYEVK